MSLVGETCREFIYRIQCNNHAVQREQRGKGRIVELGQGGEESLPKVVLSGLGFEGWIGVDWTDRRAIGGTVCARLGT